MTNEEKRAYYTGKTLPAGTKFMTNGTEKPAVTTAVGEWQRTWGHHWEADARHVDGSLVSNFPWCVEPHRIDWSSVPDPTEGPRIEERLCASCREAGMPQMCEVECELVDGQWLCRGCAEGARLDKAAQKPSTCVCGQTIWRPNQSQCSDCLSGHQFEDVEPLWVPLDDRIRAAQPETEEHAFERPGYSWP